MVSLKTNKITAVIAPKTPKQSEVLFQNYKIPINEKQQFQNPNGFRKRFNGSYSIIIFILNVIIFFLAKR